MFLKDNNSKLIFLNIFLPLFVFTSITIGAFSLISFSITKNNTIEIIENFEIANLKQVEGSIENMHVISKSVANSMFSDSHIQELIIGSPYKVATSGIFYTINSRIYPYPLIHSVYLYDGKQENFFVFGSASQIRTSDEFFDTDILKYISHYEDIKSIEPIPRKIPNIYGNDDELIDIYSYILLEKDFNTETIEKAVIVNIYVEKLIQLFSIPTNQLNQECSGFYITNSDGLIIATKGNGISLSNISDTDIFRVIESAKDRQGVVRTQWDGNNRFVSFIKMKDPDWYIISAKPVDAFLKSLIMLRNWILIITGIIAVVVFFVSYFTAKRIVSPLEKLRSIVHPFQGTGENVRITFLNSFNWFFDLSIKEYERLYSFENRFLDSAKNEVLLNLLSGRMKDPEYTSVKMPGLKLSTSIEDTSLVFLMNIDNGKEFQKNFSQSEQNSVLHDIRYIFEEMIGSVFNCETVQVNELNIAGVINVSAESGQCLIDIIKKIQEKIRNQFFVTITVSLSNYFTGISKIADEYKNTEALIQYRMVTGYESIITGEITSGRIDKFDLFNIIENLCGNMKMGKADLLMESFSSFFGQILLYTADQIYYGVTILYIKVYDELRKMVESGYFNFGIADYRDLNERFAGWELLSEVETDLKSVFRQVEDARQQSCSDKDNELVETVQDFLKSNISDINLSLKSTADHFGYSPDYLGKLFKRVSLLSVAEYIKNTRIEKACTLLSNTNMNVDIVIESIGWQNTKYFYTIFKSTYGISPTQYRRESRK